MLVMEEERTRISEHTYSPRTDMIIPTYKPGKRLSKLLKMLRLQTYSVRGIIVINTEKAHWNGKGYQEASNMEVHHLSKTEFDHGATRDRSTRYSRADVIAFMTDDAMPAGKHLIGHLAGTFRQQGSQGRSVIMAYACQLPDKDCPMIERYTRSLNYPEESCTKTKEDPEHMGIETLFASNACCVYGREKFWFQGGFTTKTISNEDIIFTGRTVLQDNYIIAYATEIKVTHSCNYGYAVQFRQNFDLVVSQTDHPEVFTGVWSESEGVCLVKQTVGHLIKVRRLWLISGMIVKSGFKYMGYQVGRCYRMLPKSLTVRYSMNKKYWKQQEKAGRTMMQSIFRIISIIVSLLTMSSMLRKIRQTKVQIEAAMFWAIVALILVVSSLCPVVTDACARPLRIYPIPNFLLPFIIFLLMVKVFSMTFRVSQLENRQKELTRKIAFAQKEQEELELRMQELPEAGTAGEEEDGR